MLVLKQKFIRKVKNKEKCFLKKSTFQNFGNWKLGINSYICDIFLANLLIMQATQNISKILALRKSKDKINNFDNLPAVRAVISFLALVSYHLKNYSITQTYEFLRTDLQHLIITVIENPIPTQIIKNAIEEYLLISPKNNNIDLDEYLNTITDIDKAELLVVGEENSGKIVALETIETLLKLNPQASNLKNIAIRAESSLAMTFALFVANMYNLEQITLTKIAKKELIFFIKESVVRYGAYAMVLGFWQPESENTRQIIREIEILASRIKMQTSHYQVVSLDYFKEKIATS